MKGKTSPSNGGQAIPAAAAHVVAKVRHQALPYLKVFDERKRPIRGLRVRNGRHHAQLTLEHEHTGLKNESFDNRDAATTMSAVYGFMRTPGVVRCGWVVAADRRVFFCRLSDGGKRCIVHRFRSGLAGAARTGALAAGP
jgi:hypothetical protein